MRLLVTAILIFVFYLLAKALIGLWYLGRVRRQAGPGGAEPMVRDPVCDTYLPRRSAIGRTIRGETVYFCSERCAGAYAAGKSGDASMTVGKEGER